MLRTAQNGQSRQTVPKEANVVIARRAAAKFVSLIQLFVCLYPPPPPRYLSVYRYNCNPIRLIPLPRDQQQHSQRPNGKEAALLRAVILAKNKKKTSKL